MHKFIFILIFLVYPHIAVAEEIELDFIPAQDNSLVMGAWFDAYDAIAANNCHKLEEIYTQHTIGGKLMNPDLILMSSYLYEKGICFPKDPQRAYQVIADNVNDWSYMRVRFAYLNEFGIGTDVNSEKAIENYYLFMFSGLHVTDKEFYTDYFATYLNIFLSGLTTTPLIRTAIDKHHSFVHSTLAEKEAVLKTLSQSSETQSEAFWLQQHIIDLKKQGTK